MATKEDNIFAEIVAPYYAHKFRNDPCSLSDEDFKIMRNLDKRMFGRALLSQPGKLSVEELRILHDNMDEPFEHNWDYAHEWRDDVLDKYADHIRNYYYNYKPEAQDIDPDIDPDEKHIGPMAQDIEQVNPAAVKETPQGIKTVDTERLALMNAGVIADLAREVKGLKQETKSANSPLQFDEPPRKAKPKESSLLFKMLGRGG
jgi:hypothetical protein